MKKNLITTAISVALASTAFAQNETTQLDPVKVYSAYAAPINQDKTASSVTVLTEKDFAARNATYVSDVLKTVPGVAIGQQGGRGTLTSLFLRGAESRHTAVVIDGVKVNPINIGNFDFGGLPISNIERIEVLRGEQSALWGSSAMGGVVYITTKSGLYKEKPFNAEVDLGLGSNNTRDASATLSGFHNGFYYALHGDSHRTKGISALSKNTFSYTTETGSEVKTGGASERDGFHRDNGSLRLGYDVGNKGVEVLAAQSSQTVHIDGYNSDISGEYSHTRNQTFKLGGYWGNEQELLKHQANISQFNSKATHFGSNARYSNEKQLNANYQLDVNFDREGEVTQAVSLLTDYAKTRYTSDKYLREKTLSEKSAALEYRLFTEQDHSFSISGRYTDNSQFKNAVTGRISGAYRLSPNFRLHASLGKAIKNPSITDLYGWDASYVGNPNLKAEKSRGGDLGLLIESTDKKHSLDVTYFARVVNDLFSSKGNNCQMVSSPWGDYLQCANYQSINLEDKSRIKGVELAYQGKWSEKLTSFANYTFTRTKDSAQKELLRRPKHVANAGLNYQISESFGSSASLSYVGKRIDSSFPSRVKMPSYTLVNLGVNYQLSKQLNVYVNLNNLFNKKYENVLGYGQDGRNIYVGLKGSF
ncbi:TPA: TonB-dependent receptor domain-containing protein [Mannheimia haemolytica]